MRLNVKELRELIEGIENGGGDATDLRRELELAAPEVKQAPRRGARFRDEEEETTEERLNNRVSDLFPNGIPLQEILDYDYRFTLNELREQCRKRGISISGDKKELAAKLIAHNSSTQNERSYVGEGI